MKPRPHARIELRPPLLIAACCLVVALAAQLAQSRGWLGALQRLEWITADMRARTAVSTGREASRQLGAVYIDDASLEAVNRSFGFRWPWPRQIHGRVVSELKAQGATWVAFDILLPEQDPPNPETDVRVPGGVVSSDEFFAREIRAASNVILAATTTGGEDGTETVLPASPFRTNAASIGLIGNQVDEDGVLRRIKPFAEVPGIGRVWNLGFELGAKALGGNLAGARVLPGRITLPLVGRRDLVIPLDSEGRFLVNWELLPGDPRLGNEAVQTLLQAGIARDNGRTNPESAWAGRVAIVGSIATGRNVSDLGPTPLSGETHLMVSHLNVANSLLMGRFLRATPWWVESLAILCLGLASVFVTGRYRPEVALGLVIVLVAGYVAAAWWCYSGLLLVVPVVLPCLGGLVLPHGAMLTYRAMFEGAERRRVRAVFSRVVSPEVVSELLKSPSIVTSGARRRVTVLFADVRGFTRMTDEYHAESTEHLRALGLTGARAEAYLDRRAAELVATVNTYLSLIAGAVVRHNGTLDKYIGDCVMAFWGAPIPSERQALDCLMAAIESQQAIRQLNRERAEMNRRRGSAASPASGDPPPDAVLPLLTLGTGINTGMATVGLMGSDAHAVNYTVFGREVNLASRIEALSGQGRILLGEETFQDIRRLAPELAAHCTALAPQEVRGFRELVPLYELDWQAIPGRVPVPGPGSGGA